MSFRKWLGRRDDDLSAEIREHIEIETRENIERGMSPQDARYAAERAFGNSGVTRELVREAKPLYWLDTLSQDVRYGLRQLRRKPLLTVTIVLTLTLGIGLNGAAFAVMEGSLFRPHVEKAAERFVRLYPQTWNTGRRMVEGEKTTYDDYLAYRDSLAPLADVAAFAPTSLVPDLDDTPAFNGSLVSCNFFRVMGLEQSALPPNSGRLLLEDDCVQTAPVAVISQEIWQNRFGSDPQILGKLIHVNRQSLAIVGIAPEKFWGGRDEPAVFVPYTMQPRLSTRDNLRQSTTAWLRLAGRMAPGVTRAQVQAQAAVVARQQDKLQPPRRTQVLATNGSVVSDPNVDDHIMWGIYLMLGIPSLILLTACANVSTLLLSRAVGRRREVAVRFSLGAGRARLMRMLLTEMALLASIATTLGLWLVYRGPVALVNFMGIRGNYSLKPDWPVYLYLGGATLLASCLAGLAPALESLRVDLASSMKGEDGLLQSQVGKWRTRDTLVATQVALSLVLLTCAGFGARAYYKLFTDDPGFDSEHLLISGVGSRALKYTPEAAEAFWKTLLERVRGLPGVDGASSANVMRAAETESIRLPGQNTTQQRPAALIIVRPAYFDTLALPVLHGRTFTEEEARQSNPAVVLVSARLAQSLWPGQDAVGKLMIDASDPAEKGRSLEVIGVVRDTKSGLFFDADYQFYKVRGTADMSDTLLLHFSGDADALSLAVRKIVRDLEPQVVPAPRTLQSLIDFNTDHIWRATRVILLLAGLPVLMSLISIYGIASYAAAQRTKEIGIRMALGAGRKQVMRLVLGSTAKSIGVGLAAGLALSILVSLAIAKGTQGAPIPLNTSDPVAYLAAALVLAVTTAAAVIGPARRAAMADPVSALRHE
jgi:predicted permease